MKFQRYIGIDYSGVQALESRLQALQVFEATVDGEPVKVRTPTPGAKNWSRLEIAQYCHHALVSAEPVIIGIDHGFSFPLSYMQRHGFSSWDAFLQDFMRHWPTADPHTCVDFVREHNPRTGKPSELRLGEQWTATAKSVFHFDVPGSVAKSTHAGLPWLLWLREMPAGRSMDSKSRTENPWSRRFIRLCTGAASRSAVVPPMSTMPGRLSPGCGRPIVAVASTAISSRR